MTLRRQFATLCLLFSVSFLAAQSTEDEYGVKLHRQRFINAGTGIDNNCGLIGSGLEFAVNPHFSLGAGGGLSGWGYKAFSEVKYYPGDDFAGSAIGLGVTHSGGKHNFETELETVSGTTEKVTMDLLPQTNIALQGYKYWKMGYYNRFYISIGYSMPMVKDKYRVVSGEALSPVSNAVMQITSPGGIILGFGFSFGF
jgi:hypothetical protein